MNHRLRPILPAAWELAQRWQSELGTVYCRPPCCCTPTETLMGLIPYRAPDSFFGGVAQMDKVGERLQRSDYRVISQMGMGLIVQLIGGLGNTSA